MNETLLRELAAKLGTTVEMLWGALIAQAGIQAWTNIALIGFFTAFIVAYFIYFRWAYKTGKFEDLEPFYGLAAIFGGVGVVISCVCIINLTGEAITALYNPQYWALKEILQVAR